MTLSAQLKISIVEMMSTTSKRRVNMSSAGVITRSTLESKVLNALDDNAFPYEYEPIRVPFVVTKTRHYTPDLVIKTKSGKIIWVEVKGWLKPADRTKMLDVKYNYPDQDIRFVFGKPLNFLSARSKTTYAAWAEKYGFDWASQHVPKEWFNE